MATFETPGLLLLLLILPVLAFFTYFWKKRGSRLPFSLEVWQGNRFKPKMAGLLLVSFISQILLWLGLVFIILALAGPTLTKRQKTYLDSGADIMIVLDESPSMAARDFPPQSRFEAAKSVIERFVKGRQNDNIGLIAFGKIAALQVPMTLDYDCFLKRLSELKIMELGDGTALGMGISLAALHLQNSVNKDKVIIILTDGENNAGEIQPITAIDLVKSLGIPLYLIGVGTNAAVPLELTDPNSGISYSGTLEEGFHEDYLRSLAVPPLCTYFSAGTQGGLDSIFQSIDSKETISKKTKLQVTNEPLYQSFILAGFLFLMFYFILRKVILKEIL
jgi:Ca-activated chloride channel homolog